MLFHIKGAESGLSGGADQSAFMNQCWLIGLLTVSTILTKGSINNCRRSPVSACDCVFYQNAISLTYSELFSVFMFVHGRLYYDVIFRMFWCEVHDKK